MTLAMNIALLMIRAVTAIPNPPNRFLSDEYSLIALYARYMLASEIPMFKRGIQEKRQRMNATLAMKLSFFI
jgi:hypothetical protein